MVLTKIVVLTSKSFTINVRGTPTSLLIKQRTEGVSPNKSISRKSITDIALAKLPTLNTRDISKATSIVTGSIRAMGIRIDDLG